MRRYWIPTLAFLGSVISTTVPLHASRSDGLVSPAAHFPWSDLPSYNASIRPLVLWHGMGDSAHSVTMLEFARLCQGVHHGMFVHSIYIEEDLDKDNRAGFFGNLWHQLKVVNAQLNDIPELRGGFDAIGFSQGGQFLRAYAEKYNNPPVKNLITFGSQHMGVSDLPTCRPGDVVCQLARLATRRGVYSSYAQHNLVQAQYFRDPHQLPAYYKHNKFLTLINGELSSTRNGTFKKNFLQLEGLVLVLFDADTTVVPRESSWFGSVAPPPQISGAQQKGWGGAAEIIPMRMQELYKNDWIGLRALDEDGRVKLLSCAGEHMKVGRECWDPIVRKYCGSVVDTKMLERQSVLVVQK